MLNLHTFKLVVCYFKFGGNPLYKGEKRTKEKTSEILKEIEEDKSLSKEYGIKSKPVACVMNGAAKWDPHR